MFNQHDPKVAAAQKIMLAMLVEVHKICEKEKITYWLDSGSLLGVVRHKGFIPWDDDIDIGMPRRDYERFMNVAGKYLPQDMFLQNRETDPGYRLNFAKIRKLNTLIIEKGETGEENYCHGIFVDIFPFDNYKYKWFIKWMRWSQLFRDKRKKYKKGSFKRMAVTFYTNVLMIVPVFISNCVRKYFERYSEYFVDEDHEYLTVKLNCCEVSCTKKKDILPVVFAENCFEGHSFYIPNNSEAVLKEVFGSDYMTVPPIGRRKTHARIIEP